MSLQRHSSPPDEADLEVTAELPVLDVMAYEAGFTSGASESASTNVSHSAGNGALPRDHGSTDTWVVPAQSLRPAAPASAEPANTAIDENRARLEINLQALSTTLRDVEERLTRKGERLAEIERALDAAVTERGSSEQRARALSNELAQARAGAAAAQSRIAELQKSLEQREAAEEKGRAQEAEARSQLAQRTSEFQAQLGAVQHDFEVKLEARAHAFSVVQQELAEARARSVGYLETLQSNEGRRSVFEELIATLDGHVEQRDTRLGRLEVDLAGQIARVAQLEAELRDRVARIAILEKQVSALSAALAQRGEQQTDIERDRDSLQQTVHALNAALSQRNDRIRSLEESFAQQTAAAAQQHAELERLSGERAQLLASTASLEASLKAATTRGEEHESATRGVQTRFEEAVAALETQRRRAEQLEAEVAGVRGELQTSSTALQAAGLERNEGVARIAAGEERIRELEDRVAQQQETVRVLQSEANASVARVKELESDLRAAEDNIHRLEADARSKTTRVEELEKVNHEWRATVEEARHAITERDNLIRRLEQETANSAVLVGHIQRSITRMDHGTEHSHEPAPDGAATRLLIRTDGESEVVHVLGRKTSIGRTPDNDLQIDAKFISRHHAVILAGPAHAIIEDLNSTNGVLVNNRRITRQPLKDGDNVVIGKTQFRFAVRGAKT
ncbi:MAG TPA: FHA domain-containing protein [Steroidobacteraceae bacterium]|nr:FHA domain-containing protein [Steroidobacteraceae bacterium]